MNRTIVLLGLTGSGKGTQAQLLADRGHFRHLSTGDLVRAEMAAGSALGLSIKESYERGELLSDEVITPAFAAELRRVGDADVLLDGFPRNLAQAKALEKLLGPLGREVDRAIFIRVSPEEAMRRLSMRRTCPSCRRIYTHHEPACPVDGATLVARADDVGPAVAEKIRLFAREIQPVVEYYRGEGDLTEVNGEQSVEQVSSEVERAIR